MEVGLLVVVVHKLTGRQFFRVTYSQVTLSLPFNIINYQHVATTPTRAFAASVLSFSLRLSLSTATFPKVVNEPKRCRSFRRASFAKYLMYRVILFLVHMPPTQLLLYVLLPRDVQLANGVELANKST